MGAEETIGQRLRRLRKERGLSQGEAAGPALTTAYVSRIEKGDRRPSIRAIREIAQQLGVSAEYLETGSPLSPSERMLALLDEAEIELRLSGDASSAGETFERVLAEASERGEAETAVRARAGLGLAAAHAGRPREAIEALEQVIDSAGINPSTRPDLYATLARSYATIHDTARAVQLLERCLDEVSEREPENTPGFVRYATYLSYALSDQGEHQRARAIIESASARAEQARDPYVRVRLYWSQARLAAADGDFSHAQAGLRRAVGLLEAIDDSIHLAQAHRLWAEVLLDDGEPAPARTHLEQAAMLFGASIDAKEDGLLQIELARVHLEEGNFELAAKTAHGALAVSPDEVTVHGRAHWAVGMAYAALGDVRAADHFGRAADFIPPGSRYRKRFLGSWADFLQREGLVEEAAKALKEVVLRDL